MAECDTVEQSLLQKLRKLVDRNPKKNDVIFSVGPQKKLVGAVRIILEAASPKFEEEFKEKWEVAVVKDGEGIPMPDFDPDAFQLFVKLTTLDTWSVEALKNLNLPPNQNLDLLSICRRFEMRNGARNLELLAASFMESFSTFKDTPGFLKMSQVYLETTLASDYLRMNELDVFETAVRWAEAKCHESQLETSNVNLRHVLGPCLFEIRFPILTNTQFTEAMELNDILTLEETVAIYKYIGSTDLKKFNYTRSQLPFKTKARNGAVTVDLNPEWAIFDLIAKAKIVAGLHANCDGSNNYYRFNSSLAIAVHGFGFLGPIEADAFYDVTVSIYESETSKFLCNNNKNIWAQKGKIFYLIFDGSIHLQSCAAEIWRNHYYFYFKLKGPKTQSFRTSSLDSIDVSRRCENGIEFRTTVEGNLAVQVLYSKT